MLTFHKIKVIHRSIGHSCERSKHFLVSIFVPAFGRELMTTIFKEHNPNVFEQIDYATQDLELEDYPIYIEIST